MGGKSPLDRAVRRSAPREYRELQRVLKQAGVNERMFGRWVEDQGQPAGWLRRQIAEALRADPDELWPKSAGGDSDRASWRAAR